MPQTHAYVRGVINLRGKIIPIIDLRMLFGMEYLPYHERTCIVIVEGKQEGRNVAMGMVVDSMTEVTAFAPEAIEPPEELPPVQLRPIHPWPWQNGCRDKNLVGCGEVN